MAAVVEMMIANVALTSQVSKVQSPQLPKGHGIHL